ncbi:MAG: trigger factor [Chitinophagaceae bacterium BSSC1]|nr:MAG: trigger factor [Chitinophagaceae bacterium BSSC1]
MATITRENIGLLHDKLIVKLNKEDYFGNFEKTLKTFAKTANIPGFRKGMVPAGLVKKMHGPSIFQDEVLKTVEKEMNQYLNKEQLDIFAQPVPLENEGTKLDMNNPGEVDFAFEVGLKPVFDVNASNIKVTKYNVIVTDEMLNEEVERLQTRNGNMTEPETASSEDHVLNVTFTELDADGNMLEGGINKANSLLVKYFAPSFRAQLIGKKKDDVVDVHLASAFEDKEREVVLSDLGLNKDEAGSADKTFKMTITKIGFVEKAALDATFFATVYPNNEITTEEDFRAAVKAEIETHFAQQTRNQIHDQIYHHLLDNTSMEFPETFLKRWLQIGGDKPKTAEEAEADYPGFVNQLKWTLISSKLVTDNKIEVLPEDIRDFAKMQLFSYMGGQLGALGDNQQWVDDYANRMMQDKKFVEDSYHRISADKLFSTLETQVAATDEAISMEAFAEKLHHHHH